MTKQVFVLGAGFAKAFFRGAPLMTDDYAGAFLEGKYDKQDFPTAHMLIRNERSRNPDGDINIERLMTRLDSKMPYDKTAQSSHELDLLLADLREFLLTRLRNFKNGPPLESEINALQSFARYCVENEITCITFNYDDSFDEVLWRVKRVRYLDDDTDRKYWHPDGGYGFFCRPSPLLVREGGRGSVVMDKTSMYLLKLHGSMNWRLRLGCPQPVMADWLVHDECWISEEITLGDRPAQQQTETYPDYPLDSRALVLRRETTSRGDRSPRSARTSASVSARLGAAEGDDIAGRALTEERAYLRFGQWLAE